MWRNDFSIELANSVTESLKSGESAVTVTCFISAKYFSSGIFRMINMTNDPCIRLYKYSNIMSPLPLSWFSLPVSTLAHIVTCQQIRDDNPMKG